MSIVTIVDSVTLEIVVAACGRGSTAVVDSLLIDVGGCG